MNKEERISVRNIPRFLKPHQKGKPRFLIDVKAESMAVSDFQSILALIYQSVSP